MGIKFDPYIDYNSFPRYGSAWVTRRWSMDFLRPALTSPQAREILDQHRPIYDPPKVRVCQEITDTLCWGPQGRWLGESDAHTRCGM